jgi:hypothetical protein
MTFLHDADVFIRAKNDHYGFDFYPGFWAWIRDAHERGAVFAPKIVRDELVHGDDELAAWVKDLPPSFFVAPSPNTAPHFSAVSEWANSWKTRASSGSEQNKADSAVRDFFGKGDFYLVSQAREREFVVVTNEVSAPGSKARIKIPDACMAVGVRHMKPHEMLRIAGARFVMQSALSGPQ